METQITVRVKLKLQSSETAPNFTKTMELYRQACNFVSDYVFNHDFEFNQNRLNKALYADIRKNLSLSHKWHNQ